MTVPGAVPSLLHLVPYGRLTTNVHSPSTGWASALQPVLSATCAQPAPHELTVHSDCRPGAICRKVPAKSSALAGPAKPIAAPVRSGPADADVLTLMAPAACRTTDVMRLSRSA